MAPCNLCRWTSSAMFITGPLAFSIGRTYQTLSPPVLVHEIAQPRRSIDVALAEQRSHGVGIKFEHFEISFV